MADDGIVNYLLCHATSVGSPQLSCPELDAESSFAEERLDPINLCAPLWFSLG